MKDFLFFLGVVLIMTLVGVCIAYRFFLGYQFGG